MKPNILDRIIGWFNPTAGLRRAQARYANEIAFRAYDAAKNYTTSDWISAQNTSANAEIGPAQATLRAKSRDLGRNNPYAVKAVNVIVNNVVGAGIEANIKGRNKTQEKQLKALWAEITESTKCDAEGRHNFRGLQALAMRTIVESGEVLALKEITTEAPRIRVLEGDYIADEKDNNANIVQGIELDKRGRRVKYFLYKQHPGDRKTTSEIVEYPAKNVAHAFKQERPGQVRGVPWAHSVIETLKDLADYQNATLIGKKVSACFGGFITTNGGGFALSSTDLKQKRERELQLKPATWRYLQPGESVEFANPPKADGYSEFVRENMRAVAAGYGISYEALTGDYSQVNFSSGRLGHYEFRRNIDSWRWNLLIPQFCDPFFEWFLEWCRLKGIDTDGASVEWIPPAHIMIDPTKEIPAEKEAVLAGFKSRRRVIREMGDDPEEIEREIKEEREVAARLGLKFDTDLSNIEVKQSENKKDAPDESASGSDQ